MMNTIELKNLTKTFGSFTAVNQMNLDIKEGEVFGFIGPNGAGKSTTIRMLLGLLQPTAGEVYIFGQNIKHEGHKIRQQIGYLPSEVHFYESMSVMEILKYSMDFYPNTSKQELEHYLELFQLDPNKKMKSLSLGNKKKVAIIQSFLHNPDLLILDEPTNGLDPLMQDVFFSVLKKEKEKGKTIFFSTHILSEIEKICDRFAIIKDGSLVDVEDVQKVKENKVRIVRVSFTDQSDLPNIQHPNILKVEKEHGTISYFISGKMNEVLKAIVQFDIEDIKIDEPSIEEIFMHHYKKEG